MRRGLASSATAGCDSTVPMSLRVPLLGPGGRDNKWHNRGYTSTLLKEGALKPLLKDGPAATNIGSISEVFVG